MTFTGNAEATIDAKGRLAIPAKFRKGLVQERDGVNWVCVPWPGGVLRVYTEREFERLASQGASSLTPGDDLAAVQSTLYGMAETLEPDSAHRIAIPKPLQERVGLGSDVVVVGAKDRLEIHDRKTWQATVDQRFAQLPTLVAKLNASGQQGI